MKYVGFYKPMAEAGENRIESLASKAKMDYIARLFRELGEEVVIVSPSWIDKTRPVREGGSVTPASPGVSVVLFPSFSSKHKLVRGLGIVHTLFGLLKYLVKNTEKGETIVAYHSQWLAYPIAIAKRIKKLRLVLEVEEIYQKVWEFSRPLDRMEKRLIKDADAYIASTELLLEALPEKPSAVVYGNYSVDMEKKPPRGDKIRLVYAGAIDSIMGGAFVAVKACRFLDERFELKVIGFGSEENIAALKEEICRVNAELHRNACEYCGVKSGADYAEFMRGMDIGVNPQLLSNIDRVCFPSKVISYLSFDLKVVSTKLSCLAVSKVDGLIEYSRDDTPEEFALAVIRAAGLPKMPSAERLEELHLESLEELKGLLR